MADLIQTIQTHTYSFIIAVIILLVGLTLGLLVKKILKKILNEIGLDLFVKRLGKNHPLEKWLSNLAAYLVYIITLVMFLNQLGITSVVLYIVVALVLLLIGATFLIGIKDLIPNLIAGLVIYRKSYWKPGKRIKVNGTEGKIEKLGLLETEIKTKKGDRIFLPNSLLVKSKVWLKR